MENVLRSKTPDLVQQEFCGLMLAHFVVRELRREAALAAGEDTDRLTFVPALRVIPRKLPLDSTIPALQGVSPQPAKTALAAL